MATTLEEWVLAITLEEWVQLNSRVDIVGTKKRISIILATHIDVHSKLIIRRHTKDDKVDIGIEKQDFMGNAFTMILTV